MSRMTGFPQWMVLAVFGVLVSGTANAEIPDPMIRARAEPAAAYLRANCPGTYKGSTGLFAYALLAHGDPVDAPHIQTCLGVLLGKFRNGVYYPQAATDANPRGSEESYYEAGVDILALEAIDKERYRKEIAAIAKYLIDGQLDYGSWYYPNKADTGGDTSITQYALLGLWRAKENGAEVPLSVFDKAADWLTTKPQQSDGSFIYHPNDHEVSRHSMTAASIGSLSICRKYLFPNHAEKAKKEAEAEAEAQKARPASKFLKAVKADLVAAEEEKAKAAEAGYSPKTSLSRINNSIKAAQDWLNSNFTVELATNEWELYYLYGVERATTLSDMRGPDGTDWNDWYAKGAARLLKVQTSAGTWLGNFDTGINTAFAILFLNRPTAKILGKPVDPVGAGLMASGRGLPDKLGELSLRGGKAQQRKVKGQFDELLTALANAKVDDVGATQEAIVEKIRVADPEVLIGQKEKLKSLIQHPDPETRKVALWALGRCATLEDAPRIMKLLDDPNVDVVIEARNALCWLSRRPNGLGVSETPFADLAEEASEEERAAAFAKWRVAVIREWREWYNQSVPYDQRDRIENLVAVPLEDKNEKPATKGKSSESGKKGAGGASAPAKGKK